MMEKKTAVKITRVLEGNCSQQHICPIRDVVNSFADKWSMSVILNLGRQEQLRFNELKTAITTISQRMLTVTLRSLEEDGLIERKQFAEIPRRVEYKLTILGQGLMEQLLALVKWADTNYKEIAVSRKKFAKKAA